MYKIQLVPMVLDKRRAGLCGADYFLRKVGLVRIIGSDDLGMGTMFSVGGVSSLIRHFYIARVYVGSDCLAIYVLVTESSTCASPAARVNIPSFSQIPLKCSHSVDRTLGILLIRKLSCRNGLTIIGLCVLTKID